MAVSLNTGTRDVSLEFTKDWSAIVSKDNGYPLTNYESRMDRFATATCP
jgi:hypothetical protein